MKKLIRTLWVVASISVLIATLYFYDGKNLSDIWVLLTWLMLILSFPTGVLISAFHFVYGEVFNSTIKTTYISLGFEWMVYFLAGYIQWFLLFPLLLRKWKSWRSKAHSVIL